MKYINIFVVIALLIVNACYALTCEQVKTTYNLEFEGNCCDMQQFTCDSTGENILSMDILSLTEEKENKVIIDEPEVEKKEEIRKLFPRKKKKHKSHFDDDECDPNNNSTSIFRDECDSAQSVQFSLLLCSLIALFLTSQLL
ncbi:hypothetical protein H8356DRAFT_1680650 [Neocallimastix lanati (nom. inval.)]|nr:hypothetical protein H8356DRAFT_1680650 [Neocallimastix sp. JGI-2020a]